MSLTSAITPNINNESQSHPLLDQQPQYFVDTPTDVHHHHHHQFDPINSLPQNNNVNFNRIQITSNYYQIESQPNLNATTFIPDENRMVVIGSNEINNQIIGYPIISDKIRPEMILISTSKIIELETSDDTSLNDTSPFHNINIDIHQTNDTNKERSYFFTDKDRNKNNGGCINNKLKLSSAAHESFPDPVALVSDDTSSIEEALRALDSAIAGEEFLFTDDVDIDDDNDNGGDILSKNECTKPNTHLQHALTEVLVKNSANAFLNDSVDQIQEIENELNTTRKNSGFSQLNQEDVIQQAKQLVNNVIDECEKYINQKVDDNTECNYVLKDNKYTSSDDILTVSDTEAIKLSFKEVEINSNAEGNFQINDLESDSFNAFTLIKNNQDSHEEQYDNNKSSDSVVNDELTDSLDVSIGIAFNSNLAASTPCVKHKVLSNATASNDIKQSVNIKINLLSRMPATTSINTDKIYSVDETFELNTNTNGTFSEPNTNESVDATITAVNIPNTQILILEPPTLKLDRDEISSEDLNTTTPLNTPIEINYRNYTWDKIETNQYELTPFPRDFNNSQCTLPDGDATFDMRERIISTTINGTFIMPTDGTFNCNETYAMPDDYDDDGDVNGYDREENRDFSLNELRKQLTLSLPNASGNITTAPPTLSDDEDVEYDDTIEDIIYKERDR